MKSNRSFFTKILLFALVVCAADGLFGLVMNPLFRLQERGKYFTTSYAVDKSADDVIVLGNSHAAQHFNANRMTDRLHSTAFNLGNQSQSILYYYPVLQSLLLHHTPKLVILNLDPEELLYDQQDYEKLSVFLPYRHRNPYIDSAISSISPLEKYKALSSFYRYNSTLGYLLLNTVSKSYGKSAESRGFDPQDGKLCDLNMQDMLNGEAVKRSDRIDPLKSRFLLTMIGELKKRNVNLLVTFAPVYEGKEKSRTAFSTLQRILSENQVATIDYYRDPRFSTNCSLFHDQNHLNTQGADMFTDLIIGEINKDHLLLPPQHHQQNLASTLQ